MHLGLGGGGEGGHKSMKKGKIAKKSRSSQIIKNYSITQTSQSQVCVAGLPCLTHSSRESLTGSAPACASASRHLRGFLPMM